MLGVFFDSMMLSLFHLVGVLSNGPIERLGMQRPILAASPDGMEFEVVPVGMERKGPEFMSMNPQMQMLTCFGHCGADCLVRSPCS